MTDPAGYLGEVDASIDRVLPRARAIGMGGVGGAA